MHADDERIEASVGKKCGETGYAVSIHVADPMWMYEPWIVHNDGVNECLQMAHRHKKGRLFDAMEN